MGKQPLFDDDKFNIHANRVERIVLGSLKSAIDAHGPITKDLLASAAKRVIGQLLAEGHMRIAVPVVTNEQLQRLEAIASAIDAAMEMSEELGGSLAVLRDENHPEGWSEVEFVERADVPVAILHHHKLQKAPKQYPRRRDGKTIKLHPDLPEDGR